MAVPLTPGIANGLGEVSLSDGVPAVLPPADSKNQVRTSAALAINHGTFGAAPYHRVDAAAVSSFKAEAALIAAGGYTSDVAFQSMDASLISNDGHSTYLTSVGGCIYIQSVVTGLQAGDIVEVDNNYFYDNGTGYASYWDQAPYWVLISPYTHNTTSTINNWIIYFEPDGLGGYTMVIGSGQYNLALGTDDLTTVLGDLFQLTRSIKIHQGATLITPLTSSRGYTYSTAGVTGGVVATTSDLTTADLALVGADPVWVDDGYLGSLNGDAVDGHIFGQDAFATIPVGMSGVLTGGTVNIAPGTYVENLTIDKSLDLVGAGEASVTVYPALSAPNPGGAGSIPPGSSNMVLVQANDVTISGITFDGDNPSLTSGIVSDGADLDARNGIITNHALGVYQNLTVHNTTIKNIYLRGIYASSGGSFYFHHSSVSNVKATTSSIGMFNFGGGGIFEYNTVANCNDAISANWSTGCQFLHNTVTGSSSGIHTDNAGNYAGSTADLIQGNTISDGATNSYAIFVFAPYIAPVVDGNIISNVDVGLTSAGAYAAVTPQFTNNVVDGMARPNATGVYVTTQIWGYGSGNVTVNFANNSVSNCTDGIYLESDAGYANSFTLAQNAIYNNSNSNVITAAGALGTLTLQYSGNWWGSNVGATVASSIQATADYTPWLDNGADINAAIGFQPDLSGLWVDDDSPQLNATNRIQEAVALVDGSTIYLMPGLYVGQVVIDAMADLNLIGAGVANTIIQAPSTAMTDYFISSGTTRNYPVLMITNSADVKVAQLTVDGAGKGNSNYRFVGIGYRNSGGSVDTCSIIDVRDTPFSGSQHGVAVYALDNDGNDRTVALHNVTVTGFQKTAIAMIGADLTATVDHCTVTGAGPTTVTAQNGIQFTDVAGGIATYNSVSSISYTGASWAASGILASGPGPVTADHNTITECQASGYWSECGGSFTNNLVSQTLAGTGHHEVYGIIGYYGTVGPVAKFRPSGIDTELHRSTMTASTSPMTYVTDVSGNTFDGGGTDTSYAIFPYAYNLSNASWQVHDNRVTNYLVGIEFYKEAGASVLAGDIDNNVLLFNDYGLDNNGGVLSVEENVFSNGLNAGDILPGNYYNHNCWSDYSGTPPYAIGGGGGNLDNNPSADCGLDLSPDSLIYLCTSGVTVTVSVGDAVTALDAADIRLEYPAELTVGSVTAASGNFFLTSSQTNHAAGQKDTLFVNLGVLTGVQDGPASLFTVNFSGSVSLCAWGEIAMYYRDLRDSTNSPIIVPLATPVAFRSDCLDPDLTVLSPGSGGFYNFAPVLNLSASDDCDLAAVYYQIDACGPTWLPIATGLAGTTYSNTAWTLPGFSGLTEAAHCVYFKVVDDAGRGNADTCSYTWCFTKDVTAPAPPTNLVAKPGHNKVHVSWQNSTSADVIGVVLQRVPWTNYPNYGTVPGTVSAPAYPASQLVGTTVFDSAASVASNVNHDDAVGLSNATRDIYYYGAFAYDAAGNYSVAAPAAQGRATSYWLGDIGDNTVSQNTSDGFVYLEDLALFSIAYATKQGDAAFYDDADFGPTFGGSPKGIPNPDDSIQFEDLVIFAINFDAVNPSMKAVPIFADQSVNGDLSLAVTGTQEGPDATYHLRLLNNRGDIKALRVTLAFDETSTLDKVELNPALTSVTQPIFTKIISGQGSVTIDVALLGTGNTLGGSGEVATLHFSSQSGTPNVTLIEGTLRDRENQPLTAALVSPEVRIIPRSYSLAQNYPNPFNPVTSIEYSIPLDCHVRLEVFNMLGQSVVVLVDEQKSAGVYSTPWAGTDLHGNAVASGIYLYRLSTDAYSATRKMMLVK
ncbi:MAG: T9SS type A sorting domain-containing protein [bacterium]|nr:T9SS type A sorting domain-containing protein [bacterium]